MRRLAYLKAEPVSAPGSDRGLGYGTSRALRSTDQSPAPYGTSRALRSTDQSPPPALIGSRVRNEPSSTVHRPGRDRHSPERRRRAQRRGASPSSLVRLNLRRRSRPSSVCPSAAVSAWSFYQSHSTTVRRASNLTSSKTLTGFEPRGGQRRPTQGFQPPGKRLSGGSSPTTASPPSSVGSSREGPSSWKDNRQYPSA